MHAYGIDRTASAGRRIRGTSRPCPCCSYSLGFSKGRKTRARQQERFEVDSLVEEYLEEEALEKLEDEKFQREMEQYTDYIQDLCILDSYEDDHLEERDAWINDYDHYPGEEFE